MELCSRCHKRAAVIFISHIENNKATNSGICLKCARELGIPQVGEIMNRMGITDEDIDRMDMEFENILSGEMDVGDDDEDNGENGDAEITEAPDSRTPPIDFKKLFGAAFLRQDPPQRQESGNESGGSKESKQDKKSKQSKSKYTELYCMNLTKKAREGKLDSIIGRDRELSRVIQILCRRQKNNPCLIGEPGVGKTAIAEALAERIASGDVPFKIKDKEVQLLDLTALVAGTQFRGQFESRMKGLIDELKSLGNVILVIDEVHSIVGAGDAEGSMNAANILKPALSRGEIQVIGATTLAEYRKYIEKDSALERRFQPIIVEEPSISDTINILKGIKKYYEAFHGIKIPDETVERAVTLSERYITDRFLPDKAIDLLDESSAYLALKSDVISQYEQSKANLVAIKAEKDELESTNETDEAKLEERYRRLADLKVNELKELENFDKLSSVRSDISLSVADLAHVIEIWTGVPASNITEHEFARIDKLEARLKQRIVGQDDAVEAVARAIKRNRAGVSYKRKPVSFIFAGPTGVGKTELVKTLAADLFDSPETLIRLDMSEFMEKHSVSRIIGSPPGYVGYDEAGQLTEKIRRKPYSVVLFDEIEKAHPDVMNILLQILDDGRITDAHGKQVNFENTVIIMTTNAGSNFVSNKAGFTIDQKAVAEDRTQKALSEFLRPEFINRVDEIITFRALDIEDFKKISVIMLNDLKAALAEKEITLSYTEAACEYIAHNSFSNKFGARNMRRYIQTHVEDVIANRIIKNYSEPVRAISIDMASDGESLNITTI